MEANIFRTIAQSPELSFQNSIQTSIDIKGINEQTIIKVAENLQLIKINPPQTNTQSMNGKYFPPNMNKAFSKKVISGSPRRLHAARFAQSYWCKRISGENLLRRCDG